VAYVLRCRKRPGSDRAVPLVVETDYRLKARHRWSSRLGTVVYAISQEESEVRFSIDEVPVTSDDRRRRHRPDRRRSPFTLMTRRSPRSVRSPSMPAIDHRQHQPQPDDPTNPGYGRLRVHCSPRLPSGLPAQISRVKQWNYDHRRPDHSRYHGPDDARVSAHHRRGRPTGTADGVLRSITAW
jgi:hypothetical protein